MSQLSLINRLNHITTKMKKTVLAALALCCSVWAGAETLPVRSFKYAGPFALQVPYQTDSVDVHSKAFAPETFLDAPLSLSVWKRQGQAVTDLPATAEGYALHLAGFVLDNTAYAEAEIKVEGLKHFHLYVDGEKQAPGLLKLEPASHEVIVKYLTGDGETEKPQVKVETAKGQLTLNDSGQRMYTLSDVLHGIRLAGASLSADGNYLLAVYRTNKKGGKSETVTRITETATGKVVAERAETLRWMPRSVAYYYTRNGVEGRQLVTVNPVNGVEKVVAEGLPDGYFQWAPTEDYLLFSLTQEGPAERKDVYEVIHPDDRQPGWRTRSYLAKYDLSSGLLQPLTFGFHNVWANDISADGRYVLMAVQTSRLTARPTSLTSLYRLDVQTLQAEPLVEGDGFLGGACFSPDGTQVLLSGSPECLGGIGKNVRDGQTPSMIDTQLYLMQLSDKQITPLTRDFAPNVQRFEWNPADGHVYFTAEDRDCISLFRMDGKTRRFEKLPVGEELVKSFALAAAAPQLAVYGESAANGERLYTLNTKTKKARLVRDLFAEQYSDIAFGECGAWDFVNSRGDTICGRYYLPPHFDANKKYPMIVNYYGGCSPTSRNFEGRYPHHAYAALGYVVYVIEPSGATGFGQEFSARHVNTAGDYVADDIIEGTRRFAEEHPFVNAQKIGCIGASYGGFMTQYLQTKTDLFAAAVSHAGISDHTSYWGEGYWGYSYSEVSMANSYPWQNPQLFVDHSPLFHADKIHTPLLFVHGDADKNVPVGESIQMYTALKLLGRETAMVLVENQDHHILDYGKRIRWQSTIFAWFAKWLQDDASWWNAMYAPKAL